MSKINRGFILLLISLFLGGIMNNKSLLQKIQNMPVPVLPTMVGALTLHGLRF